MDEPLAARVRQVIADTGRTDRDFAESIGIDNTKLSKSLTGKRKFSSLELALIAEAGARTVDWLLSGAPSRDLHFARRADSIALGEIDEAGSRVVATISERFDALDQLGLSRPVPALPTPKKYAMYLDEAKSLAFRLTAMFEKPIGSYETPALIEAVEQNLGINVVVTDLPSGCDGLSYNDNDFRAVVLATTDAPFRQRYTLAHEIAHVAFGDAKQIVIQERLWSTKNLAESRANAFAASFLAPKQEVLAEIAGQPIQDVFSHLVLHFQMSPDSMSWRLLNLGLIDQDEQAKFAKPSARRIALSAGGGGEHAERAISSATTRPAWNLVQQYVDAYWRGETTIRPAAELLGWDVAYATSFFNGSGSEDELPSPTSQAG
ncbi:ImmA/IrrE family metallo-endopeptidase [Agreia pratensis]|uniref:helix-turn-helix domain-containing protein n=1 Tax=Agreia pratensis TaxID=150121 RepID=UPI001889E151|nr:ImmA/IrrE family metallo-endopeptidase [Agreia pratensis]MBF4635783.1 ImmA/IrrE family metallo-endopeptidase [Agreia pratensis]